MKHTPAPWKVRPAQKGKLGGIEVTTDKAWLIRDLICMMPHGPEQARAEANARLIAAAPELLEALQNIMAQAVKDAEKYAPEGNEPIWAFISDASTAIHKATA